MKLLVAWQAVEAGNQRSSILWRDDGAGYKEVASNRIIAVLAGGKLWTLGTVDAPHAHLDCECAPEGGFDAAPPKRCIRVGKVKHPVLIADDGTRAWPAGLPAKTAETRDLSGTTDPSYSLRASLGGLLIGAVCNSRMACGAAHPSHDCQQVVFDAETGKPASLFNAAELTRVNGKLLSNALSALRKSEDFFDGKDAVKFARLDLHVSARGQLSGHAVFAGQTSYAASSDWGAYTMLQTEPMGQLPARLSKYAAVPTVAAKVLARRDGGFGWSELETTPQRAAAITRAFLEPVKPAENSTMTDAAY